MIIFGVALTIIGLAWFNLNTQLSIAYSGGSILAQLQAQALAQNLLSQGSPANWEALVNTGNDLTWSGIGIGLGNSTSGGTLSQKKLYAFTAMAQTNYQATKQELGVGYDYFIIIEGGNINITIGRNPDVFNAVSVYVDKRSAFLGATPVVIQAEVWTNTTLGVG